MVALFGDCALTVATKSHKKHEKIAVRNALIFMASMTVELESEGLKN